MTSYRAARVRDYLHFLREYVAVVVGPAIIVIVGAPCYSREKLVGPPDIPSYNPTWLELVS
jgi:hypothetical protein